MKNIQLLSPAMYIGDAIVNDSFFLASVSYVTVLICTPYLSLQKK